MNGTNAEDLAREIYPILVPIAMKPSKWISYTDLCERLSPRWDFVGPRSELLAEALGVIVTKCRGENLPALSAVVVRRDSGRPGQGYLLST